MSARMIKTSIERRGMTLLRGIFVSFLSVFLFVLLFEVLFVFLLRFLFGFLFVIDDSYSAWELSSWPEELSACVEAVGAGPWGWGAS